MRNISCFFNDSLVSNFFTKHENQISNSLEKRILLIAMGIFTVLALVFLTKYYLRTGAASKQELGEEDNLKILNSSKKAPQEISSDPVKPDSKKILGEEGNQRVASPKAASPVVPSDPIKPDSKKILGEEGDQRVDSPKAASSVVPSDPVKPDSKKILGDEGNQRVDSLKAASPVVSSDPVKPDSKKILGEEGNQRVDSSKAASPVVPSEPVRSEFVTVLSNLSQQLNLAPHIFPAMMNKPGVKHGVRERYHREIDRFNNFLSERLKAPVEMDVAYVCIGHGSVPEQIWPGFIFENLQSGKKVETYLIEDGWKYSGLVKVATDLRTTYHDHLKADPDEKAIQSLNRLSIQQFVCGFPQPQRGDSDFEESMNDEDKQFYSVSGNIYWKNRPQAISVLENFNQYIEKILCEGKTVVLGDHCGWLSINQDTVVLYNQLVEKYPGQIYFLWGWLGCNLMTDQPLKEEDLDPEKRSSSWTYHEKLSTTTLNFSPVEKNKD